MRTYWLDQDYGKSAWAAIESNVVARKRLDEVLERWVGHMKKAIYFEDSVRDLSPCIVSNCYHCTLQGGDGLCSSNSQDTLSRFEYLHKLRSIHGGKNAETGDEGVAEREISAELSEAMREEVGFQVPERFSFRSTRFNTPNAWFEDTRDAGAVLSEQTLENALRTANRYAEGSTGVSSQMRDNVHGVGGRIRASRPQGMQFIGTREGGPAYFTERLPNDGSVGQSDAEQSDE